MFWKILHSLKKFLTQSPENFKKLIFELCKLDSKYEEKSVFWLNELVKMHNNTPIFYELIKQNKPAEAQVYSPTPIKKKLKKSIEESISMELNSLKELIIKPSNTLS